MDLIDIIAKVRRDELDLSFITNTYGIRDQVEYLLSIDASDYKPKRPDPLSAKLETPQAEEISDSEAIPTEVEPGPENPVLGTPVEDWDWFGDFEGNAMNDYRALTYYDRDNFYPKLNAVNLRTKEGVINGSMIYTNGSIAIFQTPQGKMKIPFADLVSPSGKTYGEIQTETKLIEDSRRLKAQEVWSRLNESNRVTLTQEEWDLFKNNYPVDNNFLADNGLTVGLSNLESKSGKIEGVLAWCNQDYAIFFNQSDFTFSVMPFTELVLNKEVQDSTSGTESEDERRRRLRRVRKKRYLED